MNMKKILTILVMAFCFTIYVQAEIIDSGTCGTNVNWKLTDDGLLTIFGNGTMDNFSSNSVIQKVPWYDYRRVIVTVQIENGVANIGSCAFYECHSLASVSIPNTVISIGDAAFEFCDKLSSLSIPNSCINIDNSAFYGCSGIKSISIPSSVTSIGRYAFDGCRLSSIDVIKGNKYYDSRDSCNALIETKSNTLLKGCQKTIIPNTITTIGERALSGCSGLATITIPKSVNNIWNDAFSGCM